jgi:dolichyl-phosphate-mannose--protein O-mannosyl transferase
MQPIECVVCVYRQPMKCVRCFYRQPIECGQTIRMTHVSTNRNLHSHHFQSPLSHNLEVSAYGDNGEGDEGLS